mgnify:FL=1
MATTKSQNSNMLLAFLTLLGVIAIVAVVGFFMLRKGPEIIQGQAEVTEYRVSSKVPGRILEFRVKEGQSVNAGDTLAILEAPDVMAKMEQARAAEAAAQAQNEKAIKGARKEQIQAAYEMWQKAQAGVTIAEVISVMDCREWQATMGRIISALNYYGIDHSDVIMYTEGEEATLPKCCIMMEKMGRYCHYLIHFDGEFYDSNLGILNEYDMSKLLGYLEVKVN